jgi:hypothetical protein
MFARVCARVATRYQHDSLISFLLHLIFPYNIIFVFYKLVVKDNIDYAIILLLLLLLEFITTVVGPRSCILVAPLVVSFYYSSWRNLHQSNNYSCCRIQNPDPRRKHTLWRWRHGNHEA